jgi:hypothetical protein
VSPVRHELGFYIPEGGILQSHRRENLKSYIVNHPSNQQNNVLINKGNSSRADKLNHRLFIDVNSQSETNNATQSSSYLNIIKQRIDHTKSSDVSPWWE